MFTMFRIVAIRYRVGTRAPGNAARRDAVETGLRARRVADTAWGMLQRIDR